MQHVNSLLIWVDVGCLWSSIIFELCFIASIGYWYCAVSCKLLPPCRGAGRLCIAYLLYFFLIKNGKKISFLSEFNMLTCYKESLETLKVTTGCVFPLCHSVLNTLNIKYLLIFKTWIIANSYLELKNYLSHVVARKNNNNNNNNNNNKKKERKEISYLKESIRGTGYSKLNILLKLAFSCDTNLHE